jgi:Flp pilus assembly protein TadD
MRVATEPRSSARLERLGRYLTLDPDNIILLRDYALEAWSCGEPQACVIAMRKLMQLEEPTPEGCCLLSRALVAASDLNAASIEIEKAHRRWPESIDVKVELARCHFVAREFDQALAALPTGDAADRDAAVCALRVRLLHHASRLEEAAKAAEMFEATVGPDPAVSASVLNVLVDLLRFDEAKARAMQLVETASEPTAAPYEVCETLAIAAIDEGRPAQARDWLDRALAARQDDGRIWLLAGIADLRRGSHEGALRALSRAVELMPEHAGSHLALGWLHLIRRDLAQARSCFELGVAASPEFAEGIGSLAVVAVLQMREADADTLIRKALLLDKACATAQYARALRQGASHDRVREIAEQVATRARALRSAH